VHELAAQRDPLVHVFRRLVEIVALVRDLGQPDHRGPGGRRPALRRPAGRFEGPLTGPDSGIETALSPVQADAYAPFGGTGASGNGARSGSQSS
jgi:hypothetical protein